MQSKLFQIRWLGLLLMLVTFVGLGITPVLVRANGLITVNSTDEAINPTDGKCTLREAIISANTDTASGGVAGECPAGSGADTIELAADATYTLSAVDNTDPTLGENGLPVIVSDITVTGNGATIERSSEDAIPEFRIAQVDASGILRLNALTVAGGDSAANGSGIYNAGTLTLTDCTMTRNRNPYEYGGGIYSTGTVEIHSCTFSDNGTHGAWSGVYGGAIANEGGTLTISDSTFENNSIKYGGGAVWSSGTVTITTSVFTSNTTETNTADGGGGAVGIEGNGTIADSTFTGNEAVVYGGALFSAGTVTVDRSTFQGNAADGSHGSGGGGAIYGSVDVTNSTFYQNSAVSVYASGSAIVGSGTVINSTFADNFGSPQFQNRYALQGVTLKNSILYKTSCRDVTDGGGNLGSLAENSTCAGTIGDAMLGPLQDNGGSTKTMLPAANSPALNAAVDANCPATDQRGITRPQGSHCDIGAVEKVLIVVNSTDETINPTDGECTLREAITAANTDTASGNVAGECPAGSGADTIELGQNATYTLSVVDNTDPTLGANGLPVIVSEIAVIGNGATVERSSAGGTPEFRLVQIDANGTLYLDPLTLAGGDSTGNGSGIYNAGTLTVTGCTFTGNINPNDSGGAIYNTGTVKVHSGTFTENGASGGYPTVYGGAIANAGGTLTIADSAFTNNTVLYGGGAVWSTGTVDIKASAFTSNTTQQNQVAGGGAVSIAGSGTIADSTFTDNAALLYGGALYSEGAVSVVRSTFTGNSVSGSHGSGGGGAIYGSVNVTNSTFYQNSAVSIYATGSAMQGTGTILNSTFADNPDSTISFQPQALQGVTLKNSILYKTSCLNVTDGGGNLGSLKSNSTCAASKGDALLGLVQDNGGSTKTMLPAANSPALNAAVDVNCPATDQRGITRPQGLHCDIGAVELEPPTAATLTNPANGKQLSKNVVTLKWQAGQRVASYKIAVRVNSRTGAKVAIGTTTGLTYTTKTLAGGHWYFWRVKATSKVGKAMTGWYKFFIK